MCARPADMIGGNASVTTKAALEAHTVNLGAELAGGGLTVNAFRPGTVDTAMQTWIRDQNRLASAQRCASVSRRTSARAS